MAIVRVSDTNEAAAAVQLGVYRRMTSDQRLRAACELGMVSRQLLEAGIRTRHPEYSDADVRWATIRAWLTPALFRDAYPDGPELDP
jgi:hypothetical protein